MIDPHVLPLADLPAVPGVYLFNGAQGDTLYVGKSVNLRERVRSYFRKHGGHSRRTERLKHEVADVRIHPTGTELEALLLESRLIKQLQPAYNVRGRRYEHYPFVKITNEAYPRILVTRTLEDDGAQYFGPFHSASRLTETLDALQAFMAWRRCTQMESAPCLHAQIGRCLAPCSGQADDAYAAMIDQAGALLRGEPGPLLDDLRARMLEASEVQDFERAARLRDRLQPLTRLVKRQERLHGALNELDTLVVVPASPVSGSPVPGSFVPGGAISGLPVPESPTVGFSGPGTPAPERGPQVTLLAIRAARWVGAFSLSAAELDRPADRRKQLRRLERFLHDRFVLAPAPSMRISPVELDEVQIVGTWLFRQRAKKGAFPAPALGAAETARQALAYAASLLR